MPFAGERIRCDLACGIGADGHWRGWYTVRVDATALHALGLHPDQPTSVFTAPSPPLWWHATAERNAERRPGG
ncbi:MULTISPECIES: hypothetical protein [Streptomyces]|uniref:Uncharacterized protein n=1 Tax=Streptomyces badius TaxID=1941 RepID=A0ABQ2SSY1_STRBA|nr:MULTISPECIES: hypothetical protein [Streptomyces]GGS37007.1 hypothetical protein GCM10010253_08120 [Streptomyces badius]